MCLERKKWELLKKSPQGAILLYLPQTDQLLNPKTSKNKFFMRADGYFWFFHILVIEKGGSK